MEKVYAECGLGNESFFSTEFETTEGEYRFPRFIKPRKIDGFYIRIWIFKSVIILSTNFGFKFYKKNRNKLKIIFGISGIN